MELHRVDPERPDEQALLAAAETVLRGGIIAFPTDTVYALGCSLFDVGAVELVARLKRRDPGRAVISLISDPQAVYGLCSEVSPIAERLMSRYWPGPLSLIFKAASIVDPRVRGKGGTVALRLPKHRLSQDLISNIGGPVVASSANLTGQPPALTAAGVMQIFGNQVDLVLDGGPLTGGMASTLVDVSDPRPRLLRRGILDVTADLGDFEDLSGGRLAGAGGAQLDSR